MYKMLPFGGSLLRPLLTSASVSVGAPMLFRTFAASAAATSVNHKVGFIGLGKMGSRMVKNLLDAGITVVAYDHNRLAISRAQEMVNKSHPNGVLEARDSPADISSDPEVPVVITMLSNAADAKECYLGNKGLFKVAGGPLTSLFIDSTTIDPATTRQLAATAGMLRLSPDAKPMPGLNIKDGKPHIIDAPVTGATVGAEEATLTFMVGGEAAAADAATPLLRHMGRSVIYCGNHGAGLAAKMCNNLVLAASMAATAEALALGNRLGLDPKILTQVLNNGAARCWSSEVYNPVPGVIQDNIPSNRGYKNGLATHVVNEHLQMLLESAKTAHSPVPVAQMVQKLYEKIDLEGLGDKDFSSVYRYVYGSGCANSEWKEGEQLFSSQIP